MKNEIWKNIPGFPNYEISENSNVRVVKERPALKRGRVLTIGTIVKQSKKSIYPYLTLRDYNDKGIYKPIHYFMTLAFYGPRPKELIVCHNDGNPKNNHISNLRYGTPLDNNIDFLLEGKGNIGLDPEKVHFIRNKYNKGETISEIVKLYFIPRHLVRAAIGHYKWVK